MWILFGNFYVMKVCWNRIKLVLICLLILWLIASIFIWNQKSSDTAMNSLWSNSTESNHWPNMDFCIWQYPGCCVAYFDGCNNSRIDVRGWLFTTERACYLYEEWFCFEYYNELKRKIYLREKRYKIRTRKFNKEKYF